MEWEQPSPLGKLTELVATALYFNLEDVMPKKYITDERKVELVEIAKDMYNGRIFTDRHCRSGDEVSMVFMILTLMKPKDLKKIANLTGNKGMIYEYMDQAGPMSVNGLPTFFSCKVLTDTEAEFMFTKYEEIKTKMDEVNV